MNVLIVEDDSSIRKLMVAIVQRGGHVTRDAPNGAIALEYFKESRPDVILSDINMPVMDGLELLARIRKTDSNTLFIVTSTLDSPKYTLRALRLKANDYLIKPIAGRDLLALLDKYSDILANRTKDREVLGMIYERSLGMKIANRLDLVGKIVDRLMSETEQVILPADRLGLHLGLLEILNNAIEHGNLEITYDEKSKALEGEAHEWSELVRRRCETPEMAGRLVDLEFHLTTDRCEWLITDQGSGFDYNSIPDASDPEKLLALHGRGILLATMQFNEVKFIGRGNQVRLIKRFS